MPKNIILCSDGTGNKGGDGADTNVFKIYHAIQGAGGEDKRQQISYYDNGVGTASHAVFRAIGGATGLGFRRNVRDLYEFASRHYQEGDHIYGFGFSRGAATIRAFAGMVNHCGLVRRNTEDEDEFRRQIDAAMATYVRRGGGMSLRGLWELIRRRNLDYARQDVEIEFLGLWDTVAALGFPQIPWLDSVLNFFRRHKFYDYEPTAAVKNVCHAIAIDDERRTFWPLIWNETGFVGDKHIEQVWFPGVHSNVGGGYPRAGLANVTLDWMIARIEGHRFLWKKVWEKDKSNLANSNRGLLLKNSFLQQVHDGVNPSGKLYDSRAGLALFYRFQPRPIKELCLGRLPNNAPVRIHSSALDRLALRTAGYGPGHLPDEFVEVTTRTSILDDPAPLISPSAKSRVIKLTDAKSNGGKHSWKSIKRRIDLITNCRIVLYWAFLLSSIFLLLGALFVWINSDENNCCGYNTPFSEAPLDQWLLGNLAEILDYFLPDMFRNIIQFGVIDNPHWAGGLILVIAVYYLLRSIFRKISDKTCEIARRLILANR